MFKLIKNLLPASVQKFLPAISAVLIVGLATSLYFAWEAKIRADERWKQENAQLLERLDQQAKKMVQDSIERAVLMDSAAAAQVRANAAEEQANAAGKAGKRARNRVDSLLATGNKELQQALVEERAANARESASLREALEAQKEANTKLLTVIADLEEERKNVLDINKELREKYEEAYKKTAPGFIGRMTRDLPEKLIWSAGTYIVAKTLE